MTVELAPKLDRTANLMLPVGMDAALRIRRRLVMCRGLLLIGVMVLTPVVGSAQQPCTTDARQVVTEVYQRILERSFNPDEGMVTPLSRGQTTVREIVRSVVQTPEYQQRFLSGTREAGVTALYKHILTRDPDPTGLQLNAKRATAEGFGPVIETLLMSGEYTSKFGDYGVPGSSIRYCGRGRTSGGASSRNRFAGMDRNSDGVIQRSEWTGTRGSFATHDWNGDDVLSGDEIRFGARRGGQSAEEQDYNRDNGFNAWNEATFDQIDRNNDGRVSSREWYYDTQSFVRADRNRDGFLSRNEFLGGDMDDDRGDQFVNLDRNGNGYVDRYEWHGGAEAFDWLDRNNDNLLSRAEVEGTSRGDQFKALDANQDGRLSPDEWRWSRRSFTQQDVNGDGVLTRREFMSGGGVPTSGR